MPYLNFLYSSDLNNLSESRRALINRKAASSRYYDHMFGQVSKNCDHQYAGSELAAPIAPLRKPIDMH
ncbi:MAG TPA: hypothetical protein DDW24_12825 [Blastocatellia bacterium]|nr:hypothetical protein [Blastocatellia bacterium]